MTPHKPIHSHYQSLINRLLDKRMSTGVTLVECAIRTKDGTEVAPAPVSYIDLNRFSPPRYVRSRPR